MPKLIISKENIIIVERQIRESFLVIRGEDLYWHTYPSENGFWTTQIDNKTVTLRDPDVVGSQKFALINTGNRYEVNCVLADWNLSINDINLPKGFYNTFEITWKKLKVEHQGYEFLFIFDPAEIDETAIPLPEPTY